MKISNTLYVNNQVHYALGYQLSPIKIKII